MDKADEVGMLGGALLMTGDAAEWGRHTVTIVVAVAVYEAATVAREDENNVAIK